VLITSSRSLIALLWTLFFIIPLSCTTKNPEEEAIKKLVGKYNVALITAYKDMNPLPLRRVTSNSEFEKVNLIIDSFMEVNQIMEAELMSLGFKDIKIEQDSATVKTSEQWKYRWVDMKTGEVKVPLQEIHYEMLYHLTKEEDKWLVDRVEDVG
jgi:hypothetical protein